MSRFVEAPNLPHDCTTVIYGERYAKKLRKTLDNLGIESMMVPDNPDVDPRLAGHADLSVLHIGREALLLAPHLQGSAAVKALQNRGAAPVFPEIQQSAAYPGDAQLNLCLIGKHVLCNRKTAPDCIVDFLTSKGEVVLLACRQGYSRCAVCIVDAHSLITADRGLAVAAKAAGLDVLLISPGFIQLDGFPYGFIGGSSFKLSESKMAFTGKLDAHPDHERILRFLHEREIEPYFLTGEPAFDIGSAVPILEKC